MKILTITLVAILSVGMAQAIEPVVQLPVVRTETRRAVPVIRAIAKQVILLTDKKEGQEAISIIVGISEKAFSKEASGKLMDAMLNETFFSQIKAGEKFEILNATGNREEDEIVLLKSESGTVGWAYIDFVIPRSERLP